MTLSSKKSDDINSIVFPQQSKNSVSDHITSQILSLDEQYRGNATERNNSMRKSINSPALSERQLLDNERGGTDSV